MPSTVVTLHTCRSPSFRYCEEPQGAIVAVAAGTREVAGPSPTQEEEDQGYDTMDLRERIQYDADTRHAELIMRQLKVSSSSVHAK